METKILKHLPHEEAMELKSQIDILPGQVVSKTIVQNSAVSITLFGFDKNEEISTHESNGDALVTILEGHAKITILDKNYELKTNESIIMPAHKAHALMAIAPFKMLLTVIF